KEGMTPGPLELLTEWRTTVDPEYPVAELPVENDIRRRMMIGLRIAELAIKHSKDDPYSAALLLRVRLAEWCDPKFGRVTEAHIRQTMSNLRSNAGAPDLLARLVLDAKAWGARNSHTIGWVKERLKDARKRTK